MQFVFIVWKVKGYHNILKLSCRPPAFTSYWAFLKQGSGYSPLASSFVWLSLLWEILGNLCIAIVFKPDCDVLNFEANLIFLIKTFFLQNLNILRKKSAFKMEAFFIIFKGLSIKQITQVFLKGESLTLKCIAISIIKLLIFLNACKLEKKLYEFFTNHSSVYYFTNT